MEFAMGVLGWTPDGFWKSTMHEFMAANKGYVKANSPPEDDTHVTMDDFTKLKESINKIRSEKNVRHRYT